MRDKELIAADERGEIVLGGCFKSSETHQCKACGAMFVLSEGELQLGFFEPNLAALYLKTSFENSVAVMQARGEAYVSRPSGEWTLIVLKDSRGIHQIAENVSKLGSIQSIILEETEESILVRAWQSGEVLLEQVAPVRFAFRRRASGAKTLLPRGGDPRKLQMAFEPKVELDPWRMPEFIRKDFCRILHLPEPASFQVIEYHQGFRRVGP